MQNARTRILLGDSVDNLFTKKVLVFGLGGVGSYVVESLARSNVGSISIVDFDIVDITNLNRQIIATHSSIGLKKVDVCEKRIIDINPTINVIKYDLFVNNDTIKQFDFTNYDFVIDCIDNVTGKLLIIEKCLSLKIPVISALGTANKLDPTKLTITDIAKTYNCPLAKVMRLELRKRNINHLPVLFSDEEPKPLEKTTTLGSVSFVPSVGGLLISAYVIKSLTKKPD